MNFKVLIAFSREAHTILEEKGQAALIKSKKVSQGYDWDYREFKNDDELAGYIRGAEEANGWDNTPEVREVPVAKLKPEETMYTSEWVVFDKDGKLVKYEKIAHRDGAMYVQHGQFARQLRLKGLYAHDRKAVDQDHLKKFRTLREKLEHLDWEFPVKD